MDLKNQHQKDATTIQVQFKGSPEPTIPIDHVITPKVRKPYTITKQREKWTDEEHHRFLEALKLYGRDWRQIEEFIGTKTAVQIRSHAQKFFSKVVRGGNDSAEPLVETIEIPPPRPKRKPTHPYPRKLVDAQNYIQSPAFQPEKRICPHIVNCDTENQSPNSVLSAAMPHMLDSPISDMPDSCLSTSSCSTDFQSGSLYSINKEENLKAISSLQYNGKAILPEIKRSASSIVDISANLGIGSFEEEAGEPESTIVLFGQIVSTKDSQRPSRDSKDTFTPSKQHLAESVDNKHEKLDEWPTSNGIVTHLSHGLYYGNWRPWSWHGVNSDSLEASRCASMQWLPIPFFNGFQTPYPISCSQALGSSFMEERTHGKQLYISTMKYHSTKDTTTSTVNSTHSSVLERDILSPKRTYRSGFVPYQRCSAAGNIKPVNTVAEDDGGQRMQLSL
ncbi:unnamed protein product [Rhodiola kirilowii]